VQCADAPAFRRSCESHGDVSQQIGLAILEGWRCPNLDYAKERDQIAPDNSTINTY